MPDTVLGTEEWSSECLKTMKIKCSSDGSDSKESACSLGDLGTIPGLGSSPGGGNGSPLWGVRGLRPEAGLLGARSY